MSFLKKALDIIGNAGKSYVGNMERVSDLTKNSEKKYKRLDDKELFEIYSSKGFFSKTHAERMVAYKELKGRGYSDLEIKSYDV
ncbi:hypothetical protein [Marinobacter shengliensis]|uniref:hypothetical protein n=1 Tax=Marinobacter shengliensis TaxID=1389223 RepID=UPI002573ACD4|nr:hypothetical protein [Marinobacter shengliensis]BEH13863.1 hypothetical protein MAALD49_12310 [Marinobacter shengliensis]